MEYNVTNLFLIKKDKACIRRLIRSINSGIEPTEVSFAKTISSVITHILIEMEGSETKEEAKQKAEGYRLFVWLDIQNALLNGTMSVSDAIDHIKDLLEGF